MLSNLYKHITSALASDSDLALDNLIKVSLQLYPSLNGFIGKINVKTDENKESLLASDIKTYIILDVSGSMGQNVGRIVNKLLPGMLYNLKYKDDDFVTIITFGSKVQIYYKSVKELYNLPIGPDGMTYMCPAIKQLGELINKLEPNQKIRIMTISDGELHDQMETLEMSNKLVNTVKNVHTVNSQAIRFFTSSSQPDTRGLSSVLQLNTLNDAKLIDINCNIDPSSIIDTMANLFHNDKMGSIVKLITDQNILMNVPWATPTNSVNLTDGENIIWLKDIPKTTSVQIGDKTIDIDVDVCVGDINADNYDIILKTKIEYFFNQLKILKVIGTGDANNQIENIVKYFTDLEKSLEMSKDLLNDNSLKSRLKFFKNIIKKREKSISMKFAQVANDDKVSKFNAAQQADYLRAINVSKNSKGLARRALASGIDFDSVVRKEVTEMYKHLSELKDVSDEDHLKSFYSMESTLGGIRAVCSLIDEGILDDMDANDILKMINIVGIACTGPVGDFPDAMTYRIDEVYSGCYISLSDVLVAYNVSNGQVLTVPGQPDKTIVNVLPLFDDSTVHVFMRKYCPSILEYTASIGMRRVIAEVPMTYAYSACAGIWKLTEDINHNKSDINISIFTKLVKTYDTAVGTYFAHVVPYLTDKPDQKLSYYIANNGVTNMISPLMKIIASKDTQYMSNILRALYSYEIYQVVKKMFRHKDNSDILSKHYLDELVGINFANHKTQLQPLFDTELNNDAPNKFYDQYHCDNNKVDSIIKSSWYIDYLTILPDLLHGAYEKNPIEYIKNIKKMDENTICNALGIDYDLRTFQYYNIVQALLYSTKNDRVDQDRKEMKFDDLINKESAENMIKNYVKTQYINQYNSDISAKNKEERDVLCKLLISEIGSADQMDKTIDLWKNGLTRGTTSLSIVNNSSMGNIELKQSLLDLNNNIPDRIGKLKILLLGRDDKDNIVWNNGNVLFTQLAEFETIFTKLGQTDQWNAVKDEYKKRNRHIYRDLVNRHGHSNEKPSFYGFGHKTLEDMIQKFILIAVELIRN
jgi:uncharacterized protein YegL